MRYIFAKRNDRAIRSTVAMVVFWGLVLTTCLVIQRATATSLRSSLSVMMGAVQSSVPEQEPNNKPADANQIATPGQRTGSVKYGDASEYSYTYNNGPVDNIEDFFWLTVLPGETKRYDIVLTFDNPAADVDLFLFRKDSQDKVMPLAVSNGSSTTERITPIITLTEGTYYIGVSAYDGNTEPANYTLSVTPDSAPPPPTITNINPVSAIAGGGPFSLTVNGTNFINGQSIVRWNGNPKTTNYINDKQLIAFLSAEDIATAGTALVTVFNPPSLGGPSGVVYFPVLPPGTPELEVEPNETSSQANLLLVPGKRDGRVALGDAAQITIQLNGNLSDPIEDMYAVNLGQNSRLDVTLTGSDASANLALYLMKESVDGQLAVIGNSRMAGPVQRITTPSLLGPGRYLIGVSAVSGTSGYIIEATAPGNRLLQVAGNSAAPNSTVSVPVLFNSEGNENSISFSLSFNAAILGNPQISLGSDAAGATLVVDNLEAASGRIGVRLSKPSGEHFNAGVCELIKVDFTVNSGAGVNTTVVDFGDQPVIRGMVDASGNSVIGSYTSGLVVVVPGFEADVSPRPSGSNDGSVTVADWAQVGRFVAGLDTPVDGSEIQRADVAPKSTLGDGRLTISDWVLAGRFASGLETSVPAGGPASLLSAAAYFEKTIDSTSNNLTGEVAQQGRTVQVKEQTFLRGQENELKIELVSQGNENAIGFSINFDTSQLNYIGAQLGADSAGAILNININRLNEGRIGVGLALPSGQAYVAGLREVVKFKFTVQQNSSVNSTTVSFGDLPIARELVDVGANILTGEFKAGQLMLDPPVNLVPSLSSLEPGTVTVGGPAFTLTINGSNFVNGATTLIDGVSRNPQFVNSTQLRVVILAQETAEAGSLSIVVQNPAPGGGTSNTLNLSIINPVPAVSSISPNAGVVGGNAFTLNVTGSNFVNGAKVQFNGVDRVTTFVSPTQLSAQILTADLAAVGTATVRVVNPSPGGGTSNTIDFPIATPNPIPRISSLDPTSVEAGSAAFTLTVNGTSFVSNSVVRFSGVELPTTFVSDTKLTAQVSAENIANAGSVLVSVMNPVPGGGSSNNFLFTISVPPNPVPTISALSPATVTSGGPSFTLTVTGTNFVSNSVVRFNGADRQTTFISATEVRALIAAADIQNGGMVIITVFNPAPGGGTSNELTLTVNFAPPTISFLSPSSTVAGGPAFTLAVTGTNFAPGSVIRWNGEDRLTSFVSVTELTTQISATDIAEIGTAQVAVFSPPPGGGLSNVVTFNINQAARPLPRITGLNPNNTIAGGPEFTLTVTGVNFASDSEVRWNGAARPTTFVSSTQMTTVISAADISAIGTAQVTVFTPPAGGGESNPLTFTINQPPNPVPVIASLNPNQVVAGGPAFALTINGSNFVSGAVVQVNGADRPTTLNNAGQVTAQIPAQDIAGADLLSIRVVNPAPGGGASNELPLNVINPVPTLTSLSPAVVVEGSPALTLTVNGTGFVIGAEVLINGVPRVTSFVNSNQLTAQVPASDVVAIATLSVQVVNPGPGGGVSNALELAVKKRNPIPRITSISPETVSAGGPGFTLVVNGSSFVDGSIVRVNGIDRQTSFVSDTVLAVQLTAGDIAAATTLRISVFNPEPGGGNSNAVDLAITNPKPRITALGPDTAVAGSADVPMIVSGDGFVAASVVRFNGVDLPTTLITNTQVSVVVPAAGLINAGVYPVVVFNPEPGGGTSNIVNFTVTNPPATITVINPGQVAAGSPQFTLTIQGSDFVNGAIVQINGQDRPTTFVSSTQMTVVIPPEDIALAGSVSVAVVNPAPGGGSTNTVQLAILNPVPALTGIAPANVNAGSVGFTLTVNGSGFVQGSVVRVDGNPRATTFVSSTQLTIQIADTEVANAGTLVIDVANPEPGGGVSNSLTLTVSVQPNPVPSLRGLLPGSVVAGSQPFELIVNGSSFVPGATVLWNGSARTTTYVSDTQLKAAILDTDVANVGTAEISVDNPAPGGGVSNPLTFAITPPNPVPVVASISPQIAGVGSPGFIMTVTGSDFVPGAVVTWNGLPRLTQFVSSSQLTATIPAEDLAAVGTAMVLVINPAPGGGPSNQLVFTILAPNPVPVVTSISPGTIIEGDDAFTLTVNGDNFVPGATVLWDGSPRPTTFVSNTLVTALISDTDVASAGTVAVAVSNPAPGGGVSNSVEFVITPLLLSCQTTCFQSAQYYVLNSTRIPNGSIFIGGINFNNPVIIQNNQATVRRALEGGTGSLQQLNQQYVATQLTIVGAGGSSVGILASMLRCYGIKFAPVTLSNGVTITRSSTVNEVLSQTRLAITGNSTSDMDVLRQILSLLNGNDPANRCR